MHKAAAGPRKVAAKGGEAKRAPIKARTLAAGALRLLEYQATAKRPASSRDARFFRPQWAA